MPDQQRFVNEDLVLRVSQNVDPARFDLGLYEAFIDALCETREYQKTAIRTVLRYFLSGRYASLRQLAEENFYSNSALQERYGTFHEMERHLQLPDQLSCSVDLATATGKSYVIYGIARIMLATGAVDRVLVLCPSRTIERGLTDKFRTLSADLGLKELLPEDSHVRNPHIIHATESIVEGTICIENIHATFEHVGSSIRDSLKGKGARTLVLNDEVHHVYTPPNRDLRKWKEFLTDPEFSFHFVAGFSGTCYTGDEYFNNVVSRFSLRQAIEQGYAKAVDYVAEDTSTSHNEKFQKIYDNHLEHKLQRYRRVKPLTILVCRDIQACKRLTADLTGFLAHREGIAEEDAAKKVLIVTSNAEHQANVARLEEVDRADNPVEWITSVSMLTEGWDVQNIFQIVPHEERAFNSKLLIAQVLGRGLRIPNAYRGERPVVTVFNHDAWSANIKHLVDEVMEFEKRITSYPVTGKPIDYNFAIHHIDYTRIQELDELTPQTGEYEFTKGYVSLASQVASLESETTYARVMTGEQRRKNTLLHYRMHPVIEVADHIHSKFEAIDLEEGTAYADRYTMDWLIQLIRNSLRRVGESDDVVSEENRQRLQKAFGVVHRAASQTIRYRMKPEAIRYVYTADRRRDSMGIATLRRGDASVFFDDLSLSLSDEETRLVLRNVLEDESLPRSAVRQVSNTFAFKTPLNVVIANHTPEDAFVRQLTRTDNAQALDGWIKSTDQDFYAIEYAWRKGEHAKRASFNPDFFLKQGNHTWVIEIKAGDEIRDPAEENKAKYKAAYRHFQTVNTLQEETSYHFHFLTPTDYAKFFTFLRDGNYDFVSELDVVLDSNGE